MTERMLIIDCEATNLMQPSLARLEDQPHLVELTVLVVDAATLQPLQPLVTLQCKPPIPLPEKFTEITSITDAMVADWPPFFALYPELVTLFLGSKYLLAHNVAYDHGVLTTELARLQLTTQFPWPPVLCCTVEATQHLTGSMLSLVKLATVLSVLPEQQVLHRAAADVELLYRCCLELRARDQFPWGQG